MDIKIVEGEYLLCCSKVEPGRFVWERNLTLTLKKEEEEDFLGFLKVFEGYGFYRPWVEFFSINPKPLGFNFFGSSMERRLIELIYEWLPNLGRIYVEYYEDEWTLRELRNGFEVERSRMGKLLLDVGFRNLRNWYYPEGLREGGMKLSGEKVQV